MSQRKGIYLAYNNRNTLSGTSDQLANSLKCDRKMITNSYYLKCKIKGYNIKKLGNIVDVYQLRKNNQYLDEGTLEELADKYYFSRSTLYSALTRTGGKCYKIYQVIKTNKIRFEEECNCNNG